MTCTACDRHSNKYGLKTTYKMSFELKTDSYSLINQLTNLFQIFWLKLFCNFLAVICPISR